MDYRRIVIQVVVGVAVLGSAARADTLYVDDDGPPGGDGQSWGTAYRFLQDALAFACDPQNGITEVRVGQGTYLPDRDEATPGGSGDRGATFQLCSGVLLLGGFAGLGAPDPDERDVTLYESILTGDLLGNDGPDFLNNDENSFHVTTGSGTDETAVLDGFTITAGNADGPGAPDEPGGGMINEAGSPAIANCTFTKNKAVYGGGIRNDSANPTIVNCLFVDNTANSGAGMSNTSSSPLLDNCVFSGNSAQIAGAIVFVAGAPAAVNCTFAANTASSAGGVFWNANVAVVTLANCVFLENTAGSHGGVMRNQDSSVTTAVNCLFSGNAAPRGAVIYSLGAGAANVANSVLFGNEAAIEGGVLHNEGGSQTFVNCILRGNVPDQITDVAHTATVKFSNVEGGWPGVGNIDTDPLFVDPGNGDFRLAAGSPCIDAGHNWGVVPDVADLDSDNDFGELTPLDLDENPRFADHAATADTGCGIPAVVDIGAYEYQGDPVPVTLGDINGDGVVNVNDFLLLLAAWGPCLEDCCLADFNLDGDVGVNDFLILLANWS